MKRFLFAATILSFLAGCSNFDSGNLNPMNWFERDNTQTASAPDPVAVIDSRELLPQVTEVTQLQISNGLVVLAKGLPPTQGFWDPVLVPTNDELPIDGVLTYELRASGPTDEVVEGTEESREIQAARTITSDMLENVAVIRVVALANHWDLVVSAPGN
ncbi:MAG: membrane lipoprotein lipid attachment site-containing protein [Rhodobacteraceae bacterium]|nr:membrane lipoprotein lipid attachment site-containing protein [Paracoccaceae bacterium]